MSGSLLLATKLSTSLTRSGKTAQSAGSLSLLLFLLVSTSPSICLARSVCLALVSLPHYLPRVLARGVAAAVCWRACAGEHSLWVPSTLPLLLFSFLLRSSWSGEEERERESDGVPERGEAAGGEEAEEKEEERKRKPRIP